MEKYLATGEVPDIPEDTDTHMEAGDYFDKNGRENMANSVLSAT